MDVLAQNENFIRRSAFYIMKSYGLKVNYYDDIIQHSRSGFMKALKTYDESKGKFSAYAYIKMRSEVNDNILKKERADVCHPRNSKNIYVEDCSKLAEKYLKQDSKILYQYSIGQAMEIIKKIYNNQRNIKSGLKRKQFMDSFNMLKEHYLQDKDINEVALRYNTNVFIVYQRIDTMLKLLEFEFSERKIYKTDDIIVWN